MVSLSKIQPSMQPRVSLSRHSRVFGLQYIKANNSGVQKTRQKLMQFSIFNFRHVENSTRQKSKFVHGCTEVVYTKFSTAVYTQLYLGTTAVVQCTQLQPCTTTGTSIRYAARCRCSLSREVLNLVQVYKIQA